MFSTIYTNKNFFFLSIALVFFGFFLNPLKAKAVFDYSFQTYDVIASSSNWNWSDFSGGDHGLQRFKVEADGTLQNIIMEYRQTGVNKANTGDIYLADITDGEYWFLQSQSTGTTTEISPFISFGTTSGYIIMDQTHDYVLRLNQTKWGVRSPSSTYNNVDAWDEAGKIAVSNPPYDMADFTLTNANKKGMDFWLLLGISGTSNSEINILETPSSTCNFQVARVSYKFSQSDIDTLEANGVTFAPLFIAYGTSPSYLPYYQYENTLGEPATQSIYVPDLVADRLYTDYVMIEPNFTTGLTFYSKAFICSDSDISNCDPSFYTDNMLVESNLWTFIIPDPAENVCPANYEPVWEASYVNPFGGNQTTCETANSWWDYGLCKMWKIMLEPDQRYFDNLASLKNQVANKPPFGYFTVYSDAISDLSSATTTTSTLDVVSTTPLYYIAGDFSLIATLRTIFSSFMWIIFAFYLYKRAKHIIL